MQRIAGLATFLPLAAAHGFIKSPTPRQPGDNYKSVCGEQPWNQQTADINGNVQGIMQVVSNDVSDECRLWLCKGFLFEDNADNVQSYTAGETIDLEVDIAAPHTGYANVSVVNTSTDEVIGVPLIEFQNYASNSGVDANNTAFSVTLPEDFGGECTTAGDCVLQWFWDAPDIDQTYESCVDFTVGEGSGSAPPAEGDEEEASSPIETILSPTESVAVPTSASADSSSEIVPSPTEPVVVPTGGSDDSGPIASEEASEDVTSTPSENLTSSEPAAAPTGDAGEEEDYEGDEDCEEIPDEEEEGFEDDEDCEEIPDDEEEGFEDDEDCDEIPEESAPVESELPEASQPVEEPTAVESESPEASQPSEGGEGGNQYWKPGSGSYWEKGSGSYWEQ